MLGKLFPVSRRIPRQRPLIAFFDYHDVFEDFFPHYGVDQRTFATRWAATGNHAFLTVLQRDIGDVVWYSFSLAPELPEAYHEVVGCRVKFLPSSWLHRCLWRAFYLPRVAWRWRRAYPVYATVASYLTLASWPFIRALQHDQPNFFFVQDYATGRFDILLLIARMLGVPLIAYHSGSQPEWYQGRLVKRYTIRQADRLIVSSHDEFEMLSSRYHVPRERLVLILRGYPETLSLHRRKLMQHPCGNEIQGDRKEQVDSA